MRIFAVILSFAVVLLQYRVWVSDHGVREVARLGAAVDAQAAANLVAEVNDLKGGLTALEERARSDLGMVGTTETFYQVVTSATPGPAAPATVVTARAR
jgi:cell division protein FtsB